MNKHRQLADFLRVFQGRLRPWSVRAKSCGERRRVQGPRWGEPRERAGISTPHRVRTDPRTS
ncbi:hypothetical protein [Streptomyces sp. NPDC058463]|uniref:hypothetical protein n=1 Tax=Streptomyces sp. NPDC058463 TaxID=3346510 RepID=UPI003663A6E4